MTEKSDNWCYITRFVCCFDALPAAKQRYQERLREVRKKFKVALASEQAFNLGRSSLFFEQGLKELFGFKELPSKEEQKAYSAFLFSTIVEIPADAHIEAVREVIDILGLDYTDEFPAVFPGDTRPFLMSDTGEETPECIWQ